MYKKGLPGKWILGDYLQENMTSRRPFLLLRIIFPGRPIFIQFIPGHRRLPAAARLSLTHSAPSPPSSGRLRVRASCQSHSVSSREISDKSETVSVCKSRPYPNNKRTCTYGKPKKQWKSLVSWNWTCLGFKSNTTPPGCICGLYVGKFFLQKSCLFHCYFAFTACGWHRNRNNFIIFAEPRLASCG